MKVAHISPTLEMNQICSERIQRGEQVFRFGFGQSPFPIPKIMVQALKENAHRKDYVATTGLKKLREVIANYHSTERVLNASNVIIAPGSKEIIWLIQLIYNKPLILPNPSWVSYAPQAELAGNRVFWVDTSPSTDWLMDPAMLEHLCQKHHLGGSLLLLNYPCNPTGSCPDRKYLQVIAQIVEKYNLLVISDEIYNEILYDGSFTSISSILPDRTIVTNGLSKIYGAGGWRLGYALFPDTMGALRNAIVSAASETYSCVSTPVQHAAIKAFEPSQSIDIYKKKASRILSVISQYTYKKLSVLDTDLVPPKGGFYIFPKITLSKKYLVENKIQSAAELTKKILDDSGVALLPGVVFGRPEAEFSFRLSFVDFNGREVMAKLDNGEFTDEEILKSVPKITNGLKVLLGFDVLSQPNIATI